VICPVRNAKQSARWLLTLLVKFIVIVYQSRPTLKH